MKILIYGAGVLGSYLACELSTAQHQVTVLARGKRYDSLKQNGLIIEHFMQKRITEMNISVTNFFDRDDEYDAVFIVMQKTQISGILPILASNERCPLYIFIGNNGEIEKTYSTLTSSSILKPTILFGFMGCGGRIENGRVISVHKDTPSFTIGSPSKDSAYKTIVEEIFLNTSFKLYHSPNIDAWLKYHIALIIPAACAIHWAKGDMRKLAASGRILNLMLKGIRESFGILGNLGYPEEPKSMVKFINRPNWILYFPMKLLMKSRSAELAMRDHAMAARDEMNLLAQELSEMKEKSKMRAPALEELLTYLIK